MLQPSTILGKKILVLTAHPDDESFLAGGTIYANSQAGGKTFLICATLGEKGKSHLQEKMNDEQLQQIRNKELRTAGNELGIKRIMTLNFPDGKVNEHEDEVLAEVKKLWPEIDPQIIISFGPDGVTGHKDHVAISKVAASLAKQYELPLAMVCLPHKIASDFNSMLKSRQVTKGHYHKNLPDLPIENLVIPINGKEKLKTLKCYRSQIDEQDPFHGFPKHIAEMLLKQECFFVQEADF